MGYASAQAIAEGLEDILLGMTYNGHVIGQVERMVADTRDEERVRRIFDDPSSNPERALFEVLVGGNTSFISSQGRYEMRRDHQFSVKAYKAFTVDPTTYEFTVQASDEARVLFEYVQTELLQHHNIDAGTGEVGTQVSKVDLEFDPERTVQRGQWHCFFARYKFSFINQPEETT